MSNLATLRGRVAAILGDSTNVRYATTLLDEALRIAIEAYSQAFPQIKTATHTATAGGTQTLSTFTDLQHIIRIYYPYDADAEIHQPYTYGYYYFWQDGAVRLDLFNTPSIPQVGDPIVIDYAAPHTLEDLDAAEATTIPPMHFTAIINGAAGEAAMVRAQNMVEAYGQRSDETNKLKEWAVSKMAAYQNFLNTLVHTPPPGPALGLSGQRWRLDPDD